jgi:hypothetical protein
MAYSPAAVELRRCSCTTRTGEAWGRLRRGRGGGVPGLKRGHGSGGRGGGPRGVLERPRAGATLGRLVMFGEGTAGGPVVVVHPRPTRFGRRPTPDALARATLGAVFVTNEADWASKVMGQRESLTLDFKAALTPKNDEVALDIATFANADGGVLAYGAKENEEGGVRLATETRDLGPTEPLVTAIEDAAHSYLYGLDPRPTCVPLKLANGHRVLAVNIPPSPRLVGYFSKNERERVRYPVRVGTDRRYLRPDDVERRILSYAERAMELRLRALLDPQLPEWPLYLMHLTHMAGADGCQPKPWPQGEPIIEKLDTWGVALRLGKHGFVLPYDWIISVWRHTDLQGATPRLIPGMLVSATLSLGAGKAGRGMTGIPMPWPRRFRE